MIVTESVIKHNTGMAFTLKKGQVIRVIGQSTADFVVFNLDDVRERFDQARTKVDQGKIFFTKGDVLISKSNNVMMTIVDDTYKGTHDMEKGMCSTSFYQKWGDKIFAIYGDVWRQIGRKPEAAPDHGCWENLTDALKRWNIPPGRHPEPLQHLPDDGHRPDDRRHALLADAPRPGKLHGSPRRAGVPGGDQRVPGRRPRQGPPGHRLGRHRSVATPEIRRRPRS